MDSKKNTKIISPEELLKKVKEFIGKDGLVAILTTIIVGFINTFNFVITNGTHTDAISAGQFHISGDWEASLGRYGLIFLSSIKNGFVNRFLMICISLFFLSLASVFIVKTFKIKNKIIIFLISAFIAVAPQFAATYSFVYTADSYMLAMFLSTLSIYFLMKSEKNKYMYILAIISVFFTCILYQAYLGVIISLAIILILTKILDGEELSKLIFNFLKYMISILLGIIIYYIITKILLSCWGIEFASYKGANELGLKTLINLPSSILQCYKDYIQYFFGERIINNFAWHRKYIHFSMIIISLFIVIIQKRKYKSNELIKRFLFIIFLLFVLPIGTNIMNIIAPKSDQNLVVCPGIVSTVIFFIVLYKFFENNWYEIILKYFSILLVLILIFTHIIQNNISYYLSDQTFKKFYTVANDIYTKVTSLEGYDQSLPWMFSGFIFNNDGALYLGNGFCTGTIETYLGEEDRFFEQYLKIDIDIKRDESIFELEEFKEMPVYPNPGSIKIINDIIVIKTVE